MSFYFTSFIRELSGFLVLAIFCLSPFAPTAIAQKRSQSISVRSSGVLEEVSKKLKQEPTISMRGLAAFANELVAKRGFDYHFDVCDIIPNAKRRRMHTAEPFEQPRKLPLVDGRKQEFSFLIPFPDDSMCGECWSYIPGLKVSEKEMILVAEGNQYRVRRPKSFLLDKAELVDETRKRVLRTWQMPFQSIPIGISADGTKLYFVYYGEDWVEGLVLELGEGEVIKFRAREEVTLHGKGEQLDHPEDPLNAYLSFMRFKVGDKSYIIRFSLPCT